MYNKNDLRIVDNRIIIKEYSNIEKTSYNWETLITININDSALRLKTLNLIIETISK